jgi:hypothetical protein
MTGEERIEYRVLWFPSGARDQSRTFSALPSAEEFYEDRKVEGAWPTLETRTVVTTDWELLRNSVSDKPVPTTTRGPS